MKPLTTSLIAATALVTGLSVSGCIYVHTTKTEPVATTTTTVTTETTRPGYIVTTLPSGYTTRVYRGTTYYIYKDVYYRKTSNGYVVVKKVYY